MKRKIKIFVCYARSNLALADKFVNKFREYIIPFKKYEYSIWQDVKLKVGEKWNDIIIRNLKEADCGLLLLSVSFLNSNYISKVEIPNLINSKKIILPILLGPINLNYHDLKGLEDYQIFGYSNNNSNEKKSFSAINEAKRDKFIDKLFEELEKRLDEISG